MLWSVTIQAYSIAKDVSCAEISVYPLNDVFFFAFSILASLAECAVLSFVKFGSADVVACYICSVIEGA